MKCLLMNPISKKSPYSISVDPVIARHVGGRTKTSAWYPIGLAYVAAMIRTGGFHVEVIDPVPQGYTYESVIKKAKEFDIVFCALAPENEQDTFDLYKELIGIRRIYFGTYATAISQDLLKDNRCDIVIKGEPEITSLEVVKNINGLALIRGISYRDNGRIIDNGNRPLIENLDSIPFPARDLIDNNLYTHMSFIGNPVGLILSSRGCPFNCIFCATHLFYGKIWRARSAENVVLELKEMVSLYNLKHIIFMDDTFPVDSKRVFDICDGIIKAGLKIKWGCLARPDKSMTQAMLLRMKEAGCVEIRYGVESGVQRILDNICKDLTLHEIEDVISRTTKAGIKVLCFFMIGNPGETHETIHDTVRFAKRLKADFATFSIATPYAGTRLFEETGVKGDRLSDISKWNFSVCNMSLEELRKELKHAYLSYYFRPKYIAKVLLDFLCSFFKEPRLVLQTYIDSMRSI